MYDGLLRGYPMSFRDTCKMMIAALLLAAPAAIQAGTVDPGQMLFIPFTVTADPAWTAGYTPDRLEVELWGVQFSSPILADQIATALYDGGSLLGEYNPSVSTYNPPNGSGGYSPIDYFTQLEVGAFRADDVVSTYLNPSVVDFTSIRSGTISGLVKIAIPAGLAMTYTGSDAWLSYRVSDGSGYSWNSLDGLNLGAAYVQDGPAATPEPGTFALSGLLLAGVVAAGRRRRWAARGY